MSGGGSIGLSSDPPTQPAGSSFALIIDFEKGTPNPQRVFQAAEAMIVAFQGLDKALCASVDSKIDPIMLLEDIEAGSIKAWLGNQLNRVDDEALKDMEWKPLVGKYLVRAKYAFIRWSNKEGPDQNLLGLAKELRAIASETDVRHVPDYAPPSIQDLREGIKKIDDAKAFLLPADKMSLSSDTEGEVKFNLAVRWDDAELSAFIVRETTKFENMPMTLIVKKPDYLGKSKWDFRHGRKAISARIEDLEWVNDFQNRKIDVRPGDALKCLVRMEHRYGYDNELIDEEIAVTKVEGVMVDIAKQDRLDLDEGGKA